MKIPRNVKFGKKLCPLNRKKKCLNFEANLTSCRSNTPRVFNPEIFKIVTLLAKSQSEMQGDLTFGRKMNFGTKIDKFCGGTKQVFCK